MLDEVNANLLWLSALDSRTLEEIIDLTFSAESSGLKKVDKGQVKSFVDSFRSTYSSEFLSIAARLS